MSTPSRARLSGGFIAKALTVVAASGAGIVGLYYPGEATPWSPWPYAALYAVTASWPFWTIALCAIGLFIAATELARRGRKWLRPVLFLLASLSLVYAVARFKTGWVHQGLMHTAVASCVSVAVPVVVWWRVERPATMIEQSTASTIGMVLAGWLLWLAFPYFGEGI